MYKLKRWQWMLIAVAFGVIVGFLRHYIFAEQERERYGEQSFNDQETFERSLTTKTGTGQMLPGLVVSRDPHDPTLRTYIVRGERTGSKSGIDNKTKRFTYKTYTYYMVTKTPYVPKLPYKKPPAGAAKLVDSMWKRLAEKLGLRNPDPSNTVMEYLNQLKASSGIEYQYQWWNERRFVVITTTAMSFVAIGLIWPTIINLMLFGSLFRPAEKEEKGVSLRKVKTGDAPAKKAQPGMTEEDYKQLEAMEAKLETKLKGAGAIGGPAAAPVDAERSEGPVRQLSDKPAEPTTTPTTPEEDKSFERRTGDYYPIHRGGHGHKKEE